MALPDNKLSTNPHIYPFLGGRGDFRVSPGHDYEDGGIAINNPSQGLQYQVWQAWIDGGNQIWIGAANTQPIMLIADTDITEVSLTWDQNMNPCVAYVAAGMAKLHWYDSDSNQMVTTEFPGAKTPRVSLDDKREISIRGGISDIIFAYLIDGNLCHRRQRDRFSNEILLAENIPAKGLYKIGMNESRYFQFQILYA